MKKALVLSGGGTRGSYQNGVMRALCRIQKNRFDIITGTSIGALNGALAVQSDYRAMDDLWHNLSQDQIINSPISMDIDLMTLMNERSQIIPFVRNYFEEKGADNRPLIEGIRRLYNPEKFFASKTDFGCIAARYRTREGVMVTKEMMREHGADWLISSASAWPVFPVHRFEEGDFIDGGYYDNLPVDFALQLGAEEIIAVDLRNVPQHPNYMDCPGITYIYPKVTADMFLSFDRSYLNMLETAGYYDAMKACGVFDGVKYTFEHRRLPDWNGSFRRDILMLETRITRAGEINEKLRSAQLITDALLAVQHKKILSEKEFFYGMADYILDLLSGDIGHVYTYREFRKLVTERFDACRSESYTYRPGMNMSQLHAFVSSLDRPGRIGHIVHAVYYPDHRIVSDNALLTMYPFEAAAALFIIYILEEKEAGRIWKDAQSLKK
ncbi:MAG: patatin-like phospholipase family protein [Solobacterium sp.]|nr:patatin-like phospholipase family protein [Solobacterium sp.]